MEIFETQEADEIVAKFGAVSEADPEVYDKIAKRVFAENINWENNPNSNDFPFQAKVKDKLWRLRINDFPEEPMYTLFIEDKATITFDDRPENWIVSLG